MFNAKGLMVILLKRDERRFTKGGRHASRIGTGSLRCPFKLRRTV